jgi:hypothetical protein
MTIGWNCVLVQVTVLVACPAPEALRSVVLRAAAGVTGATGMADSGSAAVATVASLRALGVAMLLLSKLAPPGAATRSDASCHGMPTSPRPAHSAASTVSQRKPGASRHGDGDGRPLLTPKDA